MNTWIKKWIVLGFIGYLIFFFSFFLIKKDKDFSELENRNLAERPKVEQETILSGEFGKAFETYVADQFPLRNKLIAIKSNMERVLGKKDSHGVFIGTDGYFLQDFQKPDDELLKRNMGYIEAFAKEINTYMMIAPTATKVLEDKLPKYATPYDEGIVLNAIKAQTNAAHFVDLLPTLQKHHTDAIYYKTDHHWTTLGAYYAYVEFCKSYKIAPLPLEDFEIEQASTQFYGTLFSKGNFTFAKPDTLEIFHRKGEEKVTVYDLNANETKNSMYERRFLQKKDKYGVFLNQNLS